MKTKEQCREILGEELFDKVDQIFKKKRLDDLTVERAEDYLALHKEAFPYIDIDYVAENLCVNLNKIEICKTKEAIEGLKRGFYGCAGDSLIQVFVAPLKLILPPKKYNTMLDALIRHELDHMATTRRREFTDEELFCLVQKNIEAKEEIFDEDISTDPEILRSAIENYSKRQRITNQIINNINCWGLRDKYEINICGVKDYEMYETPELKVGEFVPAVSLPLAIGSQAFNEGMDAFKMKKMDNAAGQSGLMCQSAYVLGESVAQHFADVIGEEELIKRYTYGDFVGIARAYKEKTNKSGQEMRNIFTLLENRNRNHKSPLDKLLTQIRYSKTKKLDGDRQALLDEIIGVENQEEKD